MDFILKTVSFFFIIVFIASTARTINRYRKTRFIKPKFMAISVATSFLSVVLFDYLSSQAIGIMGWITLTGLGAVIGLVHSRFVGSTGSPEGLDYHSSTPYAILWAGALGITQLVTLTGAVPGFILGISFFAIGGMIGLNTALFRRFQRMRLS